jgi:hypothetical protein
MKKLDQTMSHARPTHRNAAPKANTPAAIAAAFAFKWPARAISVPPGRTGSCLSTISLKVLNKILSPKH